MAKVTVLMPVFNGEKYIREAIDSVLKQSFQDFELLIMDDGSTDRTVPLIRGYVDKRIRLILREHDFIGNLNEGLKLAHGKYVARMDADDIMHTERLKIQVFLMDEHPEYAVSGTWMKNFGDGITPHLLRPFKGEIPDPLLQMLLGNILFHPTIILRKDFLLSRGIKYQSYTAAEDYKLYVEIAKAGGLFYVEPQALLFYRCSIQQVTQTKRQEMLITSLDIWKEIVECLLARYDTHKGVLQNLYVALKQAECSRMISSDSLFRLLHEAFANVKKIKS